MIFVSLTLMTVTLLKGVSQEISPMDRSFFRTEYPKHSPFRSKRSTQFSRSTKHGYRLPYPSCLTSFRLLFFSLLLISYCTTTTAVSEINLVSSTPIILQEGNQVSIGSRYSSVSCLDDYIILTSLYALLRLRDLYQLVLGLLMEIILNPVQF